MRTVKRLHDEKLQKQLRITRDGRYKTIAVLLDHKANPANPNIKEPVRGVLYCALSYSIDNIAMNTP